MYTDYGTHIARDDGTVIPVDLRNIDYSAYLAWVEAGNTPELPAAPSISAQLMAAATAKRWDIETGGITLAGMRLATTKADQDRITSVLVNASAAGVTTVDFKAESGWFTLNLTELQDVASAIARHVQACFSAERAHHEAIDALGTLEEAVAYDVNLGWP